MIISEAWINGRTLADALSATKASHHFGKFGVVDRVSVQFPRDLYPLGIELENAFPFVVEENLLVTVHDLDAPSDIIEFTNIRFSKKALASAAAILVNDKKTQDVEALGKSLDFNEAKQALEFSEAVCDWGGGQRVWGNLNRHYSKIQLGKLLSSWFLLVKSHPTIVEAVASGESIKGLGVSFASKHLRMLEPEQFAVLDDVLFRGLGYALNPAGFNLFISDLKRLQQKHGLSYRIADLEAGIFFLTRQIVRSKRAAA